MKYKADIHNPKYPVGTILRTTRDRPGEIPGSKHIKKNSYFKIISFGPGVFQPKDGYHSYFVKQCTKTGKEYKYDNGWNQDAVEENLVDGLFEVFYLP